jgi:hypothetical protein
LLEAFEQNPNIALRCPAALRKLDLQNYDLYSIFSILRILFYMDARFAYITTGYLRHILVTIAY